MTLLCTGYRTFLVILVNRATSVFVNRFPSIRVVKKLVFLPVMLANVDYIENIIQIMMTFWCDLSDKVISTFIFSEGFGDRYGHIWTVLVTTGSFVNIVKWTLTKLIVIALIFVGVGALIAQIVPTTKIAARSKEQ